MIIRWHMVFRSACVDEIGGGRRSSGLIGGAGDSGGHRDGQCGGEQFFHGILPSL